MTSVCHLSAAQPPLPVPTVPKRTHLLTLIGPLRALAAVLACVSAPALADFSSDAGEHARDVAAQGPEDLAALEAGQNWGLARPAERNGYPEPVYEWEVSDALGVRADQIARVETIWADMRAEARALGAGFSAAEAALGTAFKSGETDTERLADPTFSAAAAAHAAADLRDAGIAAHMATEPVLTRHRIAMDTWPRGYGGTEGHAFGGH
ncbi:MAG: hypothetical protein AAGF71_08090 [Pseudomonadota bacterium]